MNNNFSEYLRGLRGIKTQKEFAEELNVSKSLYEKYERGEREPSKKFIKKILTKYPKTNINIFFNN